MIAIGAETKSVSIRFDIVFCFQMRDALHK